MYLSDLVKKTPAELKKISKDDIIKCVTGYAYQYTTTVQQLADANKKIAELTAPDEQLIVTACAFLGIEVPKNEYTKKVDTSGISMQEIIGKLMRECVNHRAS